MVNHGFVLVPLYIYPNPGTWDPLFNAAKANPNVTFQVVVNPNSGPGEGSCPDTNFINVTSHLNAIPNIQTLAYVHTADRYDCGPDGTWICPCSRPASELETEITTYQNWPTADCSTDNTKDIHIGGIFFDESPSLANCTDYMSEVTSFAKNTLTNGNTVLFNAGTQVDDAYWNIADYINVFEGTEAAYDSADIGSLDGEGVYHPQATMILHDYSDGSDILQRDVETILSAERDAMAGLYITDLDVYSAFGNNWDEFVGQMAKVVEANKAS